MEEPDSSLSKSSLLNNSDQTALIGDAEYGPQNGHHHPRIDEGITRTSDVVIKNVTTVISPTNTAAHEVSKKPVSINTVQREKYGITVVSDNATWDDLEPLLLQRPRGLQLVVLPKRLSFEELTQRATASDAQTRLILVDGASLEGERSMQILPNGFVVSLDHHSMKQAITLSACQQMPTFLEDPKIRAMMQGENNVDITLVIPHLDADTAEAWEVAFNRQMGSSPSNERMRLTKLLGEIDHSGGSLLIEEEEKKRVGWLIEPLEKAGNIRTMSPEVLEEALKEYHARAAQFAQGRAEQSPLHDEHQLIDCIGPNEEIAVVSGETRDTKWVLNRKGYGAMLSLKGEHHRGGYKYVLANLLTEISPTQTYTLDMAHVFGHLNKFDCVPAHAWNAFDRGDISSPGILLQYVPQDKEIALLNKDNKWDGRREVGGSGVMYGSPLTNSQVTEAVRWSYEESQSPQRRPLKRT